MSTMYRAVDGYCGDRAGRPGRPMCLAGRLDQPVEFGSRRRFTAQDATTPVGAGERGPDPTVVVVADGLGVEDAVHAQLDRLPQVWYTRAACIDHRGVLSSPETGPDGERRLFDHARVRMRERWCTAWAIDGRWRTGSAQRTSSQRRWLPRWIATRANSLATKERPTPSWRGSRKLSTVLRHYERQRPSVIALRSWSTHRSRVWCSWRPTPSGGARLRQRASRRSSCGNEIVC
jgi:hypothetical protein